MPIVNGSWVDWVNATNITHLGEAATYLNATTGNLFGYIMLIVIFSVTFVGSLAGTRDGEGALSIGLFITTVISYLFAGIGLVGIEAIVPLTLGCVAMVIIMYRSGQHGV